MRRRSDEHHDHAAQSPRGKCALWVRLPLEGRLESARRVAEDLRAAGFSLYASRNLDALRDYYVRTRYAGESSRRYEAIASPKFRTRKPFGLRPARHGYWHCGEWYEAPPTNPRFGCRLEIAVSEFAWQGLELDMPIVGWGPDLIWERRFGLPNRSRSAKLPRPPPAAAQRLPCPTHPRLRRTACLRSARSFRRVRLDR